MEMNEYSKLQGNLVKVHSFSSGDKLYIKCYQLT